MNMQDIFDAVPQAILIRGKDYYENGMIDSLGKDASGLFTGIVSGSSHRPYQVHVELDEAGEVLDYSCNCPYDYGDVCKHIVAVLLAISDGDYEKKNQPKAVKPNQRTDNLKDLLADLPKEKLLDIIQQQAGEDQNLKTRLMMDYAPVDAMQDLAMAKEEVRRAIRKNRRHGFLDYTGCDQVSSVMLDCLDRARERLNKGYPQSAYNLAVYLLHQGVDLAESSDSSSGYLGMAIEECLALLEEACRDISEHGSTAEQKKCFTKLCKEARHKVFEDWNHCRFELMQIAALFATPENKGSIEEVLLEIRNNKDRPYYAFEQTKEDLVRLRIIRILEGDQAARAFIDLRIAQDEFRELAFQDDIRKGDYLHAEQLCLQRIRQLKGSSLGRPSEWWYRLYEVYQLIGNRKKLITTAKTLLLQGDLKYYGRLKSLLVEDHQWDEAYPKLRSELKTKLPSVMYAIILNQENEWVLLMEEVKSNSILVFEYGKKLAKYYPALVYDLYGKEITIAAREAGNRKQYAEVCRLIRQLAQTGGKDKALALIELLARIYHRRPAMLDELGKTQRSLVIKN